MTRKELLAEVEANYEKYLSLVRLARTLPHGPHGRLAEAEETRKRYPDEAARLAGQHSDWEHGFNSGCLAAFRLVLHLSGSKLESEMGLRQFPDLDT